MADERSGTLAGRIARLRVPLGFGFAVLAIVLATPTRASLAVGAPIALLGEALRIWAAGHLNKSEEVTASGPYRWLAHPLYAGSSVIGLGMALAAGSAIVAGLIAVYLAVTITGAIQHEEAFLQGKFGDAYASYRHDRQARSKTGARAFSFSRAVANREYRAASGLVAAVLLLILKATYNGVF